ncbi:MAG: EAL domain-containing protein [Gemmatimonadota bacterium]
MTIDKNGTKSRSGGDTDGFPFPVIVLAPEGTIEHANELASRLIGTPAADLVGHRFSDLVGRSWRPVFDRTLRELLDPRLGEEVAPGRAAIELSLDLDGTERRVGLLLAATNEPSRRIVAVLHPETDDGFNIHPLHTSALEATEEGILCTDLDGRILYFNRQFRELWKVPEPVLATGDHAAVLPIVEEQLENPEQIRVLTRQLGEEPEREQRDLLHLGDRRVVDRIVRPLTIGESQIGHVLCFRDVTRYERAQETIRTSERRYRLLFERNVAGVFRASRDGTILEVNDAFARLVGCESPADLRGSSVADLYASHPERRRFGEELEKYGSVANRELELARRDGTSIWVLENSLIVEDSEIMEPVIEGTIIDITARKRLESELERMAYHDPLTDLANRRLLEERARMSLAFADRHGIQCGLIYLDLSRFKRINDTLGHEAGDDVLIQVSNRLRSCLRGSDTPARIGGDEFAALLAEVGGDRGALAVAERVSHSLSKPFKLGDRTLHVDVRIGVALYPDHASDFAGLLAAADHAMYRTKVDGSLAIEIYSPELDETESDELAQEEELRTAIEEAQLTLHYQPIIRLQDGRLVGAEALVRWNHPERGVLAAEAFIRLAERSGLIQQIDRWVLESALLQARQWAGREEPEWISINHSIKTLRDPGLIEWVSELLLKTPVSPGRIVLEVNEGIAVRSPEAVANRLRELRELGILIALDDFGTGHSSLAYIKHFPADIIKLDGFFVQDVGTNHDSRNLVKAVIQMGQALGVQVIAEKVETREQLEWLKSSECDLVQGYYTGRPVPADQLLESARESATIRRTASA